MVKPMLVNYDHTPLGFARFGSLDQISGFTFRMMTNCSKGPDVSSLIKEKIRIPVSQRQFDWFNNKYYKSKYATMEFSVVYKPQNTWPPITIFCANDSPHPAAPASDSDSSPTKMRSSQLPMLS
jgi:hypothetical protein